MENIIEEENPTIIGITETKLSEMDDLQLKGYTIKRVDRKDDGGGVLIAYKKCLENIVMVVREEKDKEEMLWLKIDNGKTKMRIGIVYMPQENDTKLDSIKEIYQKVEEEITKAENNNETVGCTGAIWAWGYLNPPSYFSPWRILRCIILHQISIFRMPETFGLC